MGFSEKEWKELLEVIVDEEAGVETMVVENNYDMKNIAAFENIGKTAAEKAANFVQEMSGDSVEVKVFKIELNSAQDFKNMANDNENSVFTKINFNGDVSGTGVLLFSEESAISMADSMLIGMGMEENSDEVFGEMRVSAINETCNLLISAFVDTIANFMNKSELFSHGIGSGFEVFIVMNPESTDKLFEKLN